MPQAAAEEGGPVDVSVTFSAFFAVFTRELRGFEVLDLGREAEVFLVVSETAVVFPAASPPPFDPFEVPLESSPRDGRRFADLFAAALLVLSALVVAAVLLTVDASVPLSLLGSMVFVSVVLIVSVVLDGAALDVADFLVSVVCLVPPSAVGSMVFVATVSTAVLGVVELSRVDLVDFPFVVFVPPLDGLDICLVTVFFVIPSAVGSIVAVSALVCLAFASLFPPLGGAVVSTFFVSTVVVTTGGLGIVFRVSSNDESAVLTVFPLLYTSVSMIGHYRVAHCQAGQLALPS